RSFHARRRGPAPAARPGLVGLHARRPPAAFAGAPARDPSQRLDEHRRPHRLPRSQLRGALPHPAHGEAHLPPRRGDRRAGAEEERRRMSIERTTIAPGLGVSRIWKGGWHLSGGHGAVDRAAAIEDMRAFAEAGITTFDVADIYTGVEELIGLFRR